MLKDEVATLEEIATHFERHDLDCNGTKSFFAGFFARYLSLIFLCIQLNLCKKLCTRLLVYCFILKTQ